MKTKILVIGIVKNGEKVLMRKKPAGSGPYKETWYLFGAELKGPNPEVSLKEVLKSQAGIEVKPTERLVWDTETKPDEKGEIAFYIYLDYMCEYISGELKAGEGIEKLEWVPIESLSNYDIVPPSLKLFERIGYL